MKLQHYNFAYQYVSRLFNTDPEKIILETKSSKGEFLQYIWERVGQKLPPDELASSDGLSYKTASPGNDITILVIIMPPPQSIPEAYFVALAHRPEKKSLFSSQAAVKRMFVLECGMPGTLPSLCEWNMDTERNGKYIAESLTPNVHVFAKTVWDQVANV